MFTKTLKTTTMIGFLAGVGLCAGAARNPDEHAKPAPAPAAHGEPEKADTHAPVKEPVAKPVTLEKEPTAPKSMAEAKPAKKPAPKPAAPKVDSEIPDVERTADQAMKMLEDGNARWMAGEVQNPSISMMRRKMTADNGQKPFVTVLTCADSRIPVERVFDRGVGEVFVVRVAGNVAGTHECGTIEYGIEHLKTPLLVVMGHSKCGAVKATAEGANVSSNIASLVDNIKPAVERARKQNPQITPEELVNAAVRENVWQSVFDLYKSSPAVVEAVKSGHVKVVGAVLDISTGKVEWMGEHPWQDALVSAFSQKAEPAHESPAPAPAKTADAEPASHGH